MARTHSAVRFDCHALLSGLLSGGPAWTRGRKVEPCGNWRRGMAPRRLSGAGERTLAVARADDSPIDVWLLPFRHKPPGQIVDPAGHVSRGAGFRIKAEVGY